MAEVQTITNTENISPNLIDTVPNGIVQKEESAPAQQNVEQTPATEVVNNAETDEIEEDDSEEDVSMMDSDDEMEAEEDDAFGEQSEEVPGPLSAEEEAAAAGQLAQSFGLSSTEEALNLVGKGVDKHISSVITNYSQHLQKEPEVAPFYDGISQQISNLRAAIDAGLTKMISDTNHTAGSSGIEVIRNRMELFMREVLRQATVICKYRKGEEIRTCDILQALTNLNRPMYWDSKETAVESKDATTEEVEDDGDDEDAMEEDEEGDNVWEKESKANEEEDGNDTYFNAVSFRAVVDVIRTRDQSSESYEVLQAATENYLWTLVEASARSANFVGRTEIGAEEVKFAIQMTQRQ